ncbi:MAG: hypothetical protein Q7R45_08325 [Sulfuricaulis sp.]|nr:hypothetical protein [Sulfuricaulis sp.]
MANATAEIIRLDMENAQLRAKAGSVTAAERERCAKIADQMYADDGYHAFYRAAGGAIAAAIRKQ